MKINTPLTQEYFDWLVYDILGLQRGEEGLVDVCHMLFLRDYHAKMQMDVAREKDGTLLRDIFTARLLGDAVVINGSPWKNPCSVLELILGLCTRMKEEFYTSYEDISPVMKVLFLDMLRSLGIMNDKNIIVPVTYAHTIIDNFCERSYEPNGYGSLFNLYDTTQDVDWRDVPIWNQMLAWVSIMKPFEELEE